MTYADFVEEETRKSLEQINTYLQRRYCGSFTVRLTPKVVDYMLSLNHERNRRIRSDHVKKLYDYMEQIGYRSRDPMAFDDTGHLVDGQHRLTALQRHYNDGSWSHEYPCVTVETMLTKEEVSTVDMKLPRNASDNLNLTESATIPRKCIEAITFYWEQFLHPGRKVFAADIASVYYAEDKRSWPRFVSEFKINRGFPRVYSGGKEHERYITSPMLLAFKEFYSSTDDATFKAFVEDLFSERPKHRILAAYRQMLDEEGTPRGTNARRSLYWRTVDTIMQYLFGKQKSSKGRVKLSELPQDGWTNKVLERTNRKNAKAKD